MDGWDPIYRAILAAFGWDEADDRASAEALHALLPRGDGFRHVGTELKHRPSATVVGCGPALDDLRVRDLPPGILVAADGASTRLMELGLLPRVVVTDLDGGPEGLQWAAEEGASMVVHAHGANRDRLGRASGFPLVAGTYQCTPDDALRPMRNLGGFTDGDRAVLLCEAFGVRQVHLACFDLAAEPSRYSGTWDPATKPRKLAFAGQVLDGVRRRGRTRLVELTPGR